MKNPFDYSEIATEKLFVDRENAQKILEANIKSCQNTTIYGQRRVGKTSLVAEVIKIQGGKNKKHLFINLDLSICMNVQEFIESFCLTLNKEIKKFKPLETRFQELGNYIRSIKPIAKINSLTGEPEYSFDFFAPTSKAPETLDDIFDLLESIAKNHTITVILDEFQTIYYWNNSNKLQWQLRSRIQRQKNIGYIFLGSSQTLISKLFMESKNAFYKSTTLIHLDNFINLIQLSKWIKERFLSTQVSIGNEQIKEILDFSKRDHDSSLFFTPIPRPRDGKLKLRKGDFYIFYTKQCPRVPPMFTAELAPVDVRAGEYRSHYAGFIDPGWGYGREGNEKVGRQLADRNERLDK
mgnify:CR=1 FL=1